MESRTEAAADSSARTFSQVVFIDIPRSYPPSTPITCRYTLVAALKPSSRDWVGIFKVGWSTTKDYHTFVWVEPCLEVVGQQSMMRQAVFKEYYLPKDEIEFYQFCYVDSTGQVRGASTPFCFRNTAEQSTESSPDDDLLVITTQEQVEQSVREKTELQKEVVQMMEKNENLHRALQKEKQEVATLKELNEQKEKEKTQLAQELEQMKGEKENLQSILQQNLREKDQLKAEMLTQMTEQMELKERNPAEQKERSQSLRLETASKQNEAHAQEKYDRAVMKINQLKEEREELRGRVDAQSEEISTLNFKIREKERELFKMKDGIQLMQVDLQSSEKENERLSAELQRLQSLTQNMADMEREKQELCRRLSQQEALQNPPDDDLRVRCQTLVCELRDAQAKLAAEREESRNSKMRAEFLDGELQQIRGQLEGLISSHEQAQQKSSKQELLLREAHETIADKDGVIEEKERMIVLMSQEKEELARENQNLISDVEGLRRVCDNLQAAAPAQSLYMHPDVTAADLRTPEQSDHLYETIGDPVEEQSLVCRHCQESFPCITREELEAHEQSHRICPFCTMICDAMEQSIFEDHVYGHEL